jgi:hypothetical protein
MGLSKTGTSSLATALRQLGHRNIHMDRKLLAYLYPERKVTFEHMYDHVDSVEDLPSALYPEELLAAYPDALFVLTVREPDLWLSSYRKHRVLMFANTPSFRQVSQRYDVERFFKCFVDCTGAVYVWVEQQRDEVA